MDGEHDGFFRLRERVGCAHRVGWLRSLRPISLHVYAECAFSVVERFDRSVVVDEHDGLGIPRLLVATHAGSVGWHPRKCDAHCCWLLVEQGNQGTHGDVTFDNVAVDECRVTRACFNRDTNFCLECREVRLLKLVDFRSVLLQVPDPL